MDYEKNIDNLEQLKELYQNILELDYKILNEIYSGQNIDTIRKEKKYIDADKEARNTLKKFAKVLVNNIKKLRDYRVSLNRNMTQMYWSQKNGIRMIITKKDTKVRKALQLNFTICSNWGYGLYLRDYIHKKPINDDYKISDKDTIPTYWIKSQANNLNITNYRFENFLEDFWKAVANMESNLPDKSDISENQDTDINKTYPLNIILHGVPGVGKTYNCKKLISLIEDGELSINEIFDSLNTNEYDDIKHYDSIESEKRVEFITFHQSYSYEDFVEGFRPHEDGSISKKSGIFKTFCKKAKDNFDNSQKSVEVLQQEGTFKELIDDFKADIQNTIDNGQEYFIKHKATIDDISDTSFGIGGSVKSPQRATFAVIERDYQNFKNGLIKSYKDIKPSNTSTRDWHGNAQYYYAIYTKLLEFEKTKSKQEIQIQKEPLKNYYLIIDEINRGNISKIFGELMTLIEDNQRYGNGNVIPVTLPYSSDEDEKFVIPNNLYIIGTMNSTDKSIALIDIALRRRFVFVRVEPRSELVPTDAKDFMEKLNKKLDKEYQIGHGYFINNFDEDLDFVIKYKIKPLLEEYYYGTKKSDEIDTIINQCK